MRLMISRSFGVVSARPDLCTFSTADSQSFRLKMNHIAGSSARDCSSAIVPSMDGTRSRRRSLCHGSVFSMTSINSSSVLEVTLSNCNFAFLSFLGSLLKSNWSHLPHPPSLSSPLAPSHEDDDREPAKESTRAAGDSSLGFNPFMSSSSSGNMVTSPPPGERQKCHLSGTGRKLVCTVAVGPCTFDIHPLTSFGFRTVADMARIRTSGGRLMMDSSHTLPRLGSPR
mmetsp:Transcript_1897/g.6192  ORF Transcript_1897/g.6192 Transcript_1897/m.6192 type:complete len:227 (-) Transcript_1897:278-958(-)